MTLIEQFAKTLVVHCLKNPPFAEQAVE